MTITMSINTVGIVRATDILQSALNDAAKGTDDAPRIRSVEIGRSVDAEAREADSERPLPASQQRAVDILI